MGLIIFSKQHFCYTVGDSIQLICEQSFFVWDTHGGGLRGGRIKSIEPIFCSRQESIMKSHHFGGHYQTKPIEAQVWFISKSRNGRVGITMTKGHTRDKSCRMQRSRGEGGEKRPVGA